MDPTIGTGAAAMLPHAPVIRLRRSITSAVRRWEDRPPTLDRLHLLGRRLGELGASDAELAVVASELMWTHRGERLATAEEVARATGSDRSGACRFLFYCVLRHASFLFDLRTCRSVAAEAHVRWPDDPLIAALLGMAEVATGGRAGDRRLSRLLRTCRDPKVRHVVLTAYVISPAPDAPSRVLELAGRMRADGQDDAIVAFREAVARRTVGDLSGALEAIDRALHQLATRPHDASTRTFVNEQLRQERERILDRTATYGRTRSLRRTTTYPDAEPPRGDHDVDESGHVTVTIHDEGGVELASGVLSPTARTRGDRPGVARARLRAPLWALSLGTTVSIELPDGSRRDVRIREVTAMDGPEATVNVDLGDPVHRAVRTPSSDVTSSATPTRRSSPA